MRVDVAPELLQWAITRSRRDPVEIAGSVPQLAAWQAGERKPTLKQLEKFARATRAPVGALLLSVPPVERLPIPDLRTVADRGIREPSPDLLDTITICTQRQEWYRDFVRSEGQGPLAFVGSVATADDASLVAGQMRDLLDFQTDERRQYPSWAQALRSLIDKAEAAGVLVMTNGVVGSNTHRPLDPDEFRGFSLADDYAPVVFINGADFKAAQIFTLAHELAHVWLGQSGVSNPGLAHAQDVDLERWCNRVAAEFLVPADSIRAELGEDPASASELQRLARLYRVSTLVVLRRVYDLGRLRWDDYRAAYQEQLDAIEQSPGGDGGNFYNSQPLRVSPQFARALIASTLEGRTLYKDAFRMLGFRKHATFEEMGRRLGVA